MSKLDTATAALAAAQKRHAECQSASNSATARAGSLRAEVVSGDASISAAELAGAENDASHSLLILEGASVGLVGLHEAVIAARAEQTLDEIVTTLPTLGDDLLYTLNAVEAALSAFVTASQAFDGYASQALLAVNAGALSSPRVKTPRYGVPTVDQTSLAQAHGDRLVAAIVTPFLEQLHAPEFATRELRTVAQAAVAPPTTQS